MRKIWLIIAASLVLSLSTMGAFTVHADEPVQTNEVKVKLTEQQKKELDTLYQDAFGKMKEVVSKYVEYGVMTEEKAQKIVSHMDKRYDLIKKNEFIPQWHMHKKGNNHHH